MRVCDTAEPLATNVFRPGNIVKVLANSAIFLIEEINGAIATLTDEIGQSFIAPLVDLRLA